MRKLSALILSFAVIYGLTLIPSGSSDVVEKKTLSYKGVNNQALASLNNELELIKSRNSQTANFSKLSEQINKLKENKSVFYEIHSKELPPQTFHLALLYLAGLVVGILGFASVSRFKEEETLDKSETHAFSTTMSKVLKELNYPVLICDSNFNITWQNNQSESMHLNTGNIQELLSDSVAMDNFEMDSQSYMIKVKELKYKSGKVSHLIQLIPQTISPRLLSNIVNGQEIQRALERSLQESKNFKNINELVAENTLKMNYLLKVSAKLIDLDLDPNLSECFIEANRLNEAIKEFLMANYHLIKDDSKITGMYVRTSEKGQRFNLNCFIPAINKQAFSTGEASKVFVRALSSLESKLNLYYPRVSFRWITVGETKGVDICLSLENKSELESILKESNA